MSLLTKESNAGSQKKKYCRSKKYGIKYVDEDPDFFIKVLNEQGNPSA
jgi:hypothetical protein